MNPLTAVVVFVVIWWLVLFMVLPFGVRRVENPEPGDDAGAPANPRLLLKAGVTTVIAIILFAIVFWALETGVISLFGDRVRPL
ncbi:MAG: DUF1467 family protein [Alphaproteobacteria bacterium]